MSSAKFLLVLQGMTGVTDMTEILKLISANCHISANYLLLKRYDAIV